MPSETTPPNSKSRSQPGKECVKENTLSKSVFSVKSFLLFCFRCSCKSPAHILTPVHHKPHTSFALSLLTCTTPWTTPRKQIKTSKVVEASGFNTRQPSWSQMSFWPNFLHRKKFVPVFTLGNSKFQSSQKLGNAVDVMTAA